MKRTSGLPLIALALAPAAMGAIEFSNKVVEIHADPGTEKVTVNFSYKNTGTSRERIHQIETNCGCLSAKPDRTLLAPGESGTLTAVFTVKGKSGRFGKNLKVISGSADAFFPFGLGARSRGNTTELEVAVNIPELVSVEPDVVSWKVGEKPATKTVRVRMNHESPIRVLKLDSSRAAVAAELVTVKEGKAYEIKITPLSTAAPVLGVVRLETDCHIPEQRRQMAFFRIEK